MDFSKFDNHKSALEAASGDIHTLEKRIREGEHQQQDFKFRIDSAQKIAKTLSAFANTDGGSLLIGVKDNGKITGIDPQEEFYMIEGAADLYCKPPIKFNTLVYEDEEGKQVLEIDIPPSSERPHYAKSEEGKWLAYIRQADENFLANRVLIHYMKDKKPETKRKNMVAYSEDERALFDLLSREKEISLSKFMRSAQLPVNKAERLLATFLKWGLIKSRATEKGIRFYLS
jgi:predicted HTH transcriptional regulator